MDPSTNPYNPALPLNTYNHLQRFGHLETQYYITTELVNDLVDKSNYMSGQMDSNVIAIKEILDDASITHSKLNTYDQLIKQLQSEINTLKTLTLTPTPTHKLEEKLEEEQMETLKIELNEIHKENDALQKEILCIKKELLDTLNGQDTIRNDISRIKMGNSHLNQSDFTINTENRNETDLEYIEKAKIAKDAFYDIYSELTKFKTRITYENRKKMFDTPNLIEFKEIRQDMNVWITTGLALARDIETLSQPNSLNDTMTPLKLFTIDSFKNEIKYFHSGIINKASDNLTYLNEKIKNHIKLNITTTEEDTGDKEQIEQIGLAKLMKAFSNARSTGAYLFKQKTLGKPFSSRSLHTYSDFKPRPSTSISSPFHLPPPCLYSSPFLHSPPT
jgi:hypothetical protein